MGPLSESKHEADLLRVLVPNSLLELFHHLGQILLLLLLLLVAFYEEATLLVHSAWLSSALTFLTAFYSLLAAAKVDTCHSQSP